jgi:hypothetical protein
MVEKTLNIRFIVTGHGRSGTKWLAHVLNRDPAVAVHHEPLTGYDRSGYAAIKDGRLSPQAFANGRYGKMERIFRRHPDRAYAEVNSFLRYCAPAMRDVFGVPVAAVVRDGRLVVRSMLKRGIYRSDNYPRIQAPVELLTPFEKCCWYWQDTYKLLLWQGIPIFRLELLNGSFDYFRAMCDALGCDVPEAEWRKRAGVPVNVDAGDVPLQWHDWQHEQFRLIAGETQKRLGYET